MDTEYVDILQNKLDLIREEIVSKKNIIKRCLSEIEILQKSAANIVELLQVEGITEKETNLQGLIQEPVVNLAYKFLQDQKEKKALHYRIITDGILQSGYPIPGKDPAANLLTHINRDDRFIRISPGTYGLKEWGLVAQGKKRKSRKTIRRK